MKNRHLRRCMICGTLLYPEFTRDTTPRLSQCTETAWFSQLLPHTAQAMTIGRSSLKAMLSSLSFTHSDG